MIDLDGTACKRLVAAVLVRTLRDVRDGDTQAELWLQSRQCRFFLEALDMENTPLDEVVERVRAGLPLSRRGLG